MNDGKQDNNDEEVASFGDVVPFPGDKTVPHRTSVLVVDDDPQVLRVMLRILDRTRYQVRTAMTRDEALSIADVDSPGFILLDLHLSSTQCADGLALLKELRASGHTQPIFMLSADPSIDHACEAARLGANGYLVKSDPHRFLERLNKLLLQSMRYTAAHTLPPSAAAYFETRGLTGEDLALLTELTRSFGDDKDLAKSLRWGEGEVRDRFDEICARLGARSSADLGRIIGVLSCFPPISERHC